jgi:D-alanine-D-alanine ligase
MKKLRVLVLMHPDMVPPKDLKGYSKKEIYEWKTEFDIVSVLDHLGHEVRPLGVHDELLPIRKEVDEWKPHIVFNLLEEFHGEALYDQNVVGYMELMRMPYTGCNPRGLVLSRGKALAKKLLLYHRIRVPAFAVFSRGHKVRRPKRLQFPLIVKSLVEHSSLGIAQASVVDNDEKLAERVEFVHGNVGTDAIAEQYIDGRELYVGVIGNQRLQVLPTWELVFKKIADNALPIATARAKHDTDYQKKRGIDHRFAKDISEDMAKFIVHNTKRIFRTLELDGYARIDYRLTDDGKLFFLEANANPDLAEFEEFAAAAEHAGLPYEKLIQKVVNLGLNRSV